MQHTEKDICLYCKFYKQTRVEHGQCRRNPPVGFGEKFVGKWAEVADSYWCGEFQMGSGAPEKIAATSFIPRPKLPVAPTSPGQPQPRPVQPRPSGDSGSGPLKLEQ